MTIVGLVVVWTGVVVVTRVLATRMGDVVVTGSVVVNRLDIMTVAGRGLETGGAIIAV
jgi:hypothetical protein